MALMIFVKGAVAKTKPNWNSHCFK